jgi:hypothetical protein
MVMMSIKDAESLLKEMDDTLKWAKEFGKELSGVDFNNFERMTKFYQDKKDKLTTKIWDAKKETKIDF